MLSRRTEDEPDDQSAQKQGAAIAKAVYQPVKHRFLRSSMPAHCGNFAR
jgi:hypothetical protein